MRHYIYTFLTINALIFQSCADEKMATHNREDSIRRVPTSGADIKDSLNLLANPVGVHRFTINSEIKYTSSEKHLLSFLGRPDSITTPNYECGAHIQGEEPWGDTVRVWHFQGLQYVTFKGSAEFVEVNFEHGDYKVEFDQITLSKSTTLSELFEAFPSTQEKFTEEGETKIVSIPEGDDSADQWELTFMKGQLIKLSYYIPC